MAKDQRQKLLTRSGSAIRLLPDRRDQLLRRDRRRRLVRADSTPAVFGVSGYTGGGKGLIAVHEQPGVEPFGLYGLGSRQARAGDEEIFRLKHTPLFVPSVGHYAQGMLVTVPITRDITTRQVTARDVHKVLADYYAGGPSCRAPLADRRWLGATALRADRLIDTNSMELAVCSTRRRRQRAGRGFARQSRRGASGAAVAGDQPQDRRRQTTGLAVA